MPGSPVLPILLLGRGRGAVRPSGPGPAPAGSPVLPILLLGRRRRRLAGVALAGTFLEALVARFAATPALAALFPKGVAADVAGFQGPPYVPYATVSVPEDRLTETFSDILSNSATVLFRLYGPTPDALAGAAAALKAVGTFYRAPLEWSGAWTTPPDLGRDVVARRPTRALDGSACWLWTVEFRCNVVRPR